jgi:hypothetical protein
MRRILSMSALSAVVLWGVLGSIRYGGLSAHPGPHVPSPPSHDYDTAIPGTQGPTSPMLANPTGRLFAANRLSIALIVQVEQLQRLLPAGFTVNPLPPPNPPGVASLGLTFDFQGQCERPGAGPSGSTPWMSAAHLARNMELSRNEVVILAAEVGDESFLDCHQAILGPGGSRLARLNASIQQQDGQMRIRFDVRDKAIGLRIKVLAEGPAAFSARSAHADPAPSQLRTLDHDQGLFTNPAQRFSIMADAVSVPITDDNFRLTLEREKSGDAGEGTLGVIGLPGGRLPVVGVLPNFTFQRWFENFFQPE